MKNVMIVGLFIVVSAASAQTNTQESCQSVYARVSAQREAEFKDSNAAALTQYGKALESIKAAYKQKGDIDSYSIVDAESKSFAVTKVVSVDSPSLQYAEAVGFYRKQIQDNKASYEVKKVALLKQYVAALQAQIKDLMARDKMEEAKAVADSKKTAEFELAALESKQSNDPVGIAIQGATATPDAKNPVSVVMNEALPIKKMPVKSGVPVAGDQPNETTSSPKSKLLDHANAHFDKTMIGKWRMQYNNGAWRELEIDGRGNVTVTSSNWSCVGLTFTIKYDEHNRNWISSNNDQGTIESYTITDGTLRVNRYENSNKYPSSVLHYATGRKDTSK